MSSFERKFGKYAINYLPLIMILCYGVGYIIRTINPGFLYYLSLDPYKIVHGQIWRIITWIILPPTTSNFLLMMVMLFCVYSIAVSIERVIGTYQFNVYILSGIGITVLGSLILLVVFYFMYGLGLTEVIFGNYSIYISSYYIYISLFVVFALSFPDARFLFMFFIPVKAKWMIIIYVVDFVIDFYAGNIFQRVALIAALINFALFWFRNKKGRVHLSPNQRKMRREFRQSSAYTQNSSAGRPLGSAFGGASKTPTSGPRHRCAICGSTEADKPDMQFRFCSKCEGDFEYCEDHLYTHTHVRRS